MSIVTIADRWGVRGGTAANLASVNETPLVREMIVETDTRYFKIGNGTTPYNSLPYAGIYPASSIPITDAGGYFTSTNVEAALQELGAAGSSAGADLTATARFYDECYGNAVTQAGWVSVTASGAISVQQSVAGMNGAYSLTCGGGSGTSAGVIHGGFYCEVGSGEIRAAARVQPSHTPSGSQQSQYIFGLKAGSTTTDAGDRIQFRSDDTTGGWLFNWTCAAGTPTSGASVIPGTITGGTTQLLEIAISANGLSAAFSIDGTVIDTLTIPAGFTAMKPYLMSRKSGVNGAASSLYVDKVLVEQDR